VRLYGKGNNILAAESFADDSALFEVFVDGSQPTSVLAPRKKKPHPTTPPADQSPDDLRRDLDRLDREAGATSE
jgi:hypothetical protein